MNKKQIVMLYGLCGGVENFSPQEAFFSNTAEVFIPDWYKLFHEVIDENKDIIAQISSRLITYLNHCGVKNPILVGHSMGGVIALHMVADNQYPVEKLVILDTSLTPSQEKKTIYKALTHDFMRASDKPAFIEKFFRKYLFLDSDDKKITASIIEVAKSRPNLFWFKALASAVKLNFPEMLHRLSVPTLYIGGRNPFSDIDQLKKMNANINIIQVSSGHFVTLFAADAVNEALS